MSPSTTVDRFSETAVAMDPTDPSGRRLTAGANWLTSGHHMVFSSLDGGGTWGTTFLFESATQGGFFADPGVAWDNFGTGGANHVFHSALDVDTRGGTAVEVVKTTWDAGLISSVLVEPSTNEPDKPMIATDPRSGSGSVYVAYDTNPSAAGSGQPLMVAASHDSGQTFGTPVTVWNSGGDIGAWPAVAGDGTLYVVWEDYCGLTPSQITPQSLCSNFFGQVLISKSTDGGTNWSSQPTRISQTTAGFGSILPNYGTECTEGCPARPVGPSPQIAIDHSGGPRDGTIYVVYGDGPIAQIGASTVPATARMHIYLQESKDGGANWSSRIRLDSGNPNDAWQPSVAVDQSNGNVVVAWYDRRDDASNHLYRPYFSESLSDSNGVAQFAAQLPAADVQSDPSIDCSGSGDYLQIAAAAGVAHPVWTDTRTGLPAIFTATIDETTAASATSTPLTGASATRPANGTGWRLLPGGASDIAVGADCQAWIIGQNAIDGGGGTWYFDGRNWQPFPGGGVRIAVHPDGLPRLVNSRGDVYRLLGSGAWQQLPGAGRDIASQPDFREFLWMIGLDSAPGGHGVWRFSVFTWFSARGGGERIAAGPGDEAWVVNASGEIWHRPPGAGAWSRVPGFARDIGVGADGSVWVIGQNAVPGGYQTYRYNGTGWDAVNGGGLAITVGPDGMPWLTNDRGQIWERV